LAATQSFQAFKPENLSKSRGRGAPQGGFFDSPTACIVPFLRKVKGMRFAWDAPYSVDSSTFAKAFWSDPIPFERRVPKTAAAFRAAAGKSAFKTTATAVS
jgi:hypothetical protein